MDRKYFAVAAAILLTASALAQAPNRTSTSSRAGLPSNISNLMNAEGTEINATLVTSLDLKTAKAGDAIVARATETIKVNGAVVPNGTRLVGHVTRASARSGSDAEPPIGIVFDKAALKNGKEISLRGGINALASADAEPIASAGETGWPAGTSGNAIEGAVNTIAYSTSRAPHAIPRTFGGVTENGQFVSDSRGVFGVFGLRLSAAGPNDTDGTIIASTGNSVHLKSGARLLIVFRVQDKTSKSSAI
jgi:hypothetical protein